MRKLLGVPGMKWPSPWSPREAELLAAALRLMQQKGYDGLTLDAVAARAQASKATIFRRWPTRAELVLAALFEGVRHVGIAPKTGTLRGDLLQIGQTICDQAHAHQSTLRAVVVEIQRNPALNDVVQQQILNQAKAMIRDVLRKAVDRAEIDDFAAPEELWDMMLGYLVFRAVWSIQPPTRRTVQALVDGVILPSLSRG